MVTIREAVSSDSAIIAEFNRAMALETEHLELDASRVQRGVDVLLADRAKGLYLVAEMAGKVIGQAMITYEWSDWRNGTFWWIQSVYVEPGHRRRGVFRALYEKILSMGEADAGVCGIRLYVESENVRAQKVYHGLGMKETPYRMFEIDFVIQR